MFGFFRKDPDKLLKRATAEKADGKIEAAIETLRSAFRAVSKGSVGYPVETYLRLPAYLQDAKRPQEAWQEYLRLLVEGFHMMPTDACLLPMFHATIFDKMRLFLQRENRALMAVGYGMGSLYASAVGAYRQQRVDDLLRILDQDNERVQIIKLLKKAKSEHLATAVAEATAPYRKSISSTDASIVISAVCEALNVSTKFAA